MIKHHYVDRRPNRLGAHEVHREGCPRIPSVADRLYLGMFGSSREAVKKAAEHYKPAKGCHSCYAL